MKYLIALICCVILCGITISSVAQQKAPASKTTQKCIDRVNKQYNSCLDLWDRYANSFCDVVIEPSDKNSCQAKMGIASMTHAMECYLNGKAAIDRCKQK